MEHVRFELLVLHHAKETRGSLIQTLHPFVALAKQLDEFVLIQVERGELSEQKCVLAAEDLSHCLDVALPISSLVITSPKNFAYRLTIGSLRDKPALFCQSLAGLSRLRIHNAVVL
ncbi:MAG: hypothetical protein WBW73_23215 [Rhodoplanes sp.]